MKGFINNFYTYDFTGSFTMTTVQMKMISKSIWNLLKKKMIEMKLKLQLL